MFKPNFRKPTFVYLDVDGPQLDWSNISDIKDTAEKSDDKEGREKQAVDLIQQANKVLANYAERIGKLPEDDQEILKDQIREYVYQSIKAHDTNGVRGLSGDEFRAYGVDLLANLHKIIQGSYAPSEQGRKDWKERRASRAEWKAKIVARNAEKAAKAAQEQAQERQVALTEQERINLGDKLGKADRAAESAVITEMGFDLTKLDNPQTIQRELDNFKKQEAKFQEEVSALSEKISDYKTHPEKVGSDEATFQRRSLDSKITQLERKRVALAHISGTLVKEAEWVRSRAEIQHDANLKGLHEGDKNRLYSTLDAVQKDISRHASNMGSYSKYDLDFDEGNLHDIPSLRFKFLNDFKHSAQAAIDVLDYALAGNLPAELRKELQQARSGIQKKLAEEPVRVNISGDESIDVEQYSEKTVKPTRDILEKMNQTLEAAKRKAGTPRQQKEAMQSAQNLARINDLEAAVKEAVKSSASGKAFTDLQSKKKLFEGKAVS